MGAPAETRMRLRYGVNQADECWAFAGGPDRERTQALLRQADTRLVRLFLFDKRAPDPVRQWPTFATYVQGVLDLGATPMITFAKSPRPVHDARGLRWFAGLCGEVVWSCCEQWGPEAVSGWYWSVWNEPNNQWIGGGLSFELYRRVYEAVATAVHECLAPHLGGRRLRVGGPSPDGFEPFWMDWIWRFVDEIDDDLVGFVDWHCYGDWRDLGQSGAPADLGRYRSLIMARVGDYEARCRAVGALVEGQGIENICSELNTHSHCSADVRARFNHSVFGAAFYVAALLGLIRGGADAEMFWTGTEDRGGYGMIGPGAAPAPAYLAKRLCARHVRAGDRVSFPAWEDGPPLDTVVARDNDGRGSVLVVHRAGVAATYDLARLDARLGDWPVLRRIDEGTGNRVVCEEAGGKLRFDGYGVAVMTNLDTP